MSRPARRIAAVVALTVAAISLLAPPAAAHSALESSNPAQGEVLTELPGQVELTFNQQIAPEFAAVALSPGTGGTASALEVRVQGTRLIATVTDKTSATDAAGRWQLSYRVTSADGHPIEGSMDFEVQPPKTEPTETPTTGATDSSTEDPADDSGVGASTPENPRESSRESFGDPWTSTLVLGTIALVVTVGTLVFLKRRSDAE